MAHAKRSVAFVAVLWPFLLACAGGGDGPDSDRSGETPADSARLACAAAPGGTDVIDARLGDPVPLRLGQAIRIVDEGLTVRVAELANSPCPEGVACVWEGVGVGLRYEKGDTVEEGMNRVIALGYQVTIVQTDYETCAVLRVGRAPASGR